MVDDLKTRNRLYITLGVVSLTMLTTLIAIFFLNKFLPQKDLIFGNARYNIIGIIIFVLVIAFVFLASRILIELKPDLSDISIAAITGLILFGIELVYKFIQNVFILGLGLDLDFVGILKAPMILGIFAVFISHVRVRYLRNKKIGNLILAYIILWLIAGYFLK